MQKAKKKKKKKAATTPLIMFTASTDGKRQRKYNFSRSYKANLVIQGVNIYPDFYYED